MSIRNVLFDLDGTLVDSRPGIDYSIRAALKAVLPSQTHRRLNYLVGPPIRDIFARILATTDETLLDQLERQFRISYDAIGWRQTRTYRGAVHVYCAVLGRWKCVVLWPRTSRGSLHA